MVGKIGAARGAGETHQHHENFGLFGQFGGLRQRLSGQAERVRKPVAGFKRRHGVEKMLTAETGQHRPTTGDQMELRSGKILALRQRYPTGFRKPEFVMLGAGVGQALEQTQSQFGIAQGKGLARKFRQQFFRPVEIGERMQLAPQSGEDIGPSRRVFGQTDIPMFLALPENPERFVALGRIVRCERRRHRPGNLIVLVGGDLTAGEKEAQPRIAGIGAQQIDEIGVRDLARLGGENATDECLMRIDDNQGERHHRTEQRDRPGRRESRPLNGRGSESRSLQQHL